MRDTGILGGVDELHICLLVVVLQRLETLLCQSLDALLLLLLRMRVERQNGLAQAGDTLLRGTADSDDLAAMRANDAELLDVLLLRPTLTLGALLPLRDLGGADVAELHLARSPEVRPVEGQQRPVHETLRYRGTELPLLVDDAQRLELDESTEFAVRGGWRVNELL